MTDTLPVLAGPMAAAEVLAVVLGDVAQATVVVLSGWAFQTDTHGFLPVLVAQAGGTTAASQLALDSDQSARLEFFVQALGLESGESLHGLGQGDQPFDAAEWSRRWSAIFLALAQDIMALYGQLPAQAVARRHGAMLVRAAGRVRAASELRPLGLGFAAGSKDVQVQSHRTPYSAFFAVQEYDIAWRKFDGTMGQPAPRAVFLSGDAVTVLPYDAIRDRVLLVDQFRAGPFARGDAQPWQLETVAGRIDPGETPEQAARREAVEEAGLELSALLPVAQYYPTPGANTEFLYSYVALTDLPDDQGGIFGLETEAEDIRTHIIAFADLMAMVANGAVANAPLILTALWLERERPRLRTAKP